VGKKFIDLSGQTLGKLTVLKRLLSTKDKTGQTKSWYLCRCICGVEKAIGASSVKSGRTKSCGCFQRERLGDILRLRAYESLYNRLKRCAERNGHEVSLTYSEFIEFTEINECHYCGGKVFWTQFDMAKNGRAYNLDRKDNTLGYTVENCVVCCKRCNFGKHKGFTYLQWKALGKFMKSRPEMFEQF
jgi:hypothetical protein